jgi:hypothetical protein
MTAAERVAAAWRACRHVNGAGVCTGCAAAAVTTAETEARAEMKERCVQAVAASDNRDEALSALRALPKD